MRISPDIRQRRLPLGRVYIYLCLVLRALPDTFSSSLEVSQPVIRMELGLQTLSCQCFHALWGGSGRWGAACFPGSAQHQGNAAYGLRVLGRRASSLLVCPYSAVLVLWGHSLMSCETSHFLWALDFDFAFFTPSSQNLACFTA